MYKLICFLAAIGFLVACNKTTPSTNITNADIIYVNATEGGSHPKPIDFKLNDSMVIGADSLNFMGCSGYLSVPVGVKNVSVWQTGGNKLRDTSFNCAFNNHYSVFAVGPWNALWQVVALDDLSKPSEGYAKVRFANFCSSNPRLYFKFGNSTVDSLQYYYDPVLHKPYISSFGEIVAGTASLTAYNTDNTSMKVGITFQTFLSNHIYTVIFCDSSTTGSSGYYIDVITNY